MDCSPPGSSVHGISQARILEWVTISFSIYVEYVVQNAGLDESQAGMKITGRKINHFRYADHSVLKSVLCVSVSTAALQIGSSVPSF